MLDMGYIRHFIGTDENGKRIRKFEHVMVWEAANGPLPHGWIVHHKNENKLDNRLENLEGMSRADHMLTHAGGRKINGEWWKLCPECGVEKNITTDYHKKKTGGSNYICKICWNLKTKAYSKAARARATAAGKPLQYSKTYRERRKLLVYGPPTPLGRRKKT